MHLRVNVHCAPDDVQEGWKSFLLEDHATAREKLNAGAATVEEWVAVAQKRYGGKVTLLRFDLEHDTWLSSLPLIRWHKASMGKRFPHHPSGVQVARVRTHEDASCRVAGGPLDFRTYGGTRRVVDWLPVDDVDTLDTRWLRVRTTVARRPDPDRLGGFLLEALPVDPCIEWENPLWTNL